MLPVVRFFVGSLMIAGLAAPAWALSPEGEKLAAAIEANGCVFSEESGLAIKEASGLDDAQGQAAAQELMKADRISEGDDGYVLRSPACDAKAEATEAARLAPAVAAMTLAIRSASCVMTRATHEDILEHSGLTETAAEKALDWMMAREQLVKNGEDLKLKSEGCL